VRDGDIRVKTDIKYRALYNDMKKERAITDFHDLFFVCTCIGFSANERNCIERGDDRFWSNTISPTEWSCYYAMMMKLNDLELSSICDDRQVIATMQEYSNAGIELLIQDFLGDYLLPGTRDSEPQLDPSLAETLPVDFLYYILEQSEANNWVTLHGRYS
jgi:hypothetical protein